jgi:hypothetical protein
MTPGQLADSITGLDGAGGGGRQGPTLTGPPIDPALESWNKFRIHGDKVRREVTRTTQRVALQVRVRPLAP